MFFRYRREIFEFGDYQIQLKTPRNFDRFAQEGKRYGISEQAFPLAGVVWPSSQLLCHLLLEYDTAGKKILELGCGMGLASLLLKTMGRDVTALDIHPRVGDMLQRNTKLNRLQPIPFVHASWAEPIETDKFDLIVGSDLLYEPIHVKTLSGFLNDQLADCGEVVILSPDRGQLEPFTEDMRALGFSNETLATPSETLLTLPYEINISRFVRG